MAGIDEYTVLMLHMDGADGSPTFTDSSASARTATVVGDAQIDTAQSVFGGASGLFDGSGDAITFPDSADWIIGGDYSVDFRVRFNALPALVGHLVGQLAQDTTNYGWLLWKGNGTINFSYSSNGTSLSLITGSWTPSLNTWYHVAFVRNGTAVNIYIDGVSVASGTMSVTTYNSTNVLGIGNRTSGTGFPHNGWIDELRISKGVARWTSNFTPPTEAYSVEVVVPPTDDANSTPVIELEHLALKKLSLTNLRMRPL